MRAALFARLALAALLAGALLVGCSKDHDDSLTSVVDPSTLPPVPTNLTVQLGNARVVLAWSLPTGTTADGYRIYRAVDGGAFSERASIGAVEARFIDTQVTDGTSYSYRVAALQNSLEGSPSSAVIATPAAFGLLLEGGAEVTGGNTILVGSRRVPVDLVASPNTVSFVISEDSTFAGVQSQAFVPTNPRVVFQLSPGDGPKVVFARFTGTSGERSEVVSASIRLDTKAIILSLAENSGGQILTAGDTLHVTMAADTTGGTATVDIGDLAGLNLFDDGTNGDPIPFDGSYERDFVIEPVDLVNGIVKGAFTDDVGNEAAGRSAATRVTIADPPQMSLFRRNFTVVLGNSVTLRWMGNHDTDFAAYRIFRSPPNQTGTITTDDTIAGEVTSQSEREFTDTGLTPGASYKWGLGVVDLAGFVSPLDSITVTVGFNPVISATAITPANGTTATVFTYRCTYSHPLNKAPSLVLLVVDEAVSYPMPQQGSGSDWVGGEDFVLGINLSDGTHTFHFEATDQDGSTVRSPIAGVFGGPLVFP